MTHQCTTCGYPLNTQIAPGLSDACPRCLAEFLMHPTSDHNATTTNGPNPHEPPPLKAGDTLGGMVIVEFLSQGGMGFVYKAKQPQLERVVALKILHPRLAQSPDFVQRFHREAKALASLSHPNIVHVYDHGQEGELSYLVMEFVDGASLRQILTTQRMSPQTALKYVPQICDALQYAHAHGVIHRDIKPENILIDRRGTLKVADFGLAKMSAVANPMTHATQTGQVMGTAHYMAPEQMEGSPQVDHRADIYSLGVVFYEMLTGELPVGRFPLPSERVSLDVQLDQVVLKSLQRDPEKRYQQVSEVRESVTQTHLKPPTPKLSPTNPDHVFSLVLKYVFAILQIFLILVIPPNVCFILGHLFADIYIGGDKAERFFAWGGMAFGVVLSLMILWILKRGFKHGLLKLAVVVAVILGVVLPTSAYFARQHRKAEVERSLAIIARAQKQKQARTEVGHLWSRFQQGLQEGQAGPLTGGNIAPLLEPAWNAEVKDDVTAKIRDQNNIHGYLFINDRLQKLVGAKVVGISVSLEKGTGTITLDFDHELWKIPLVRHGNQWYFARQDIKVETVPAQALPVSNDVPTVK